MVDGACLRWLISFWIGGKWKEGVVFRDLVGFFVCDKFGLGCKVVYINIG